MKIGAAQMKIIPLDIKRNIEKAKIFVKNAHNRGCNIICFPELFLTGPLRKENLSYAQEIPNMYTEEFCQLAKEYGLYLIMGTIIEREGDNLYNTSLLIDDTGKILGKYRKIKLWAGEKNYIKRGDKAEVFETKFGKIGIEICWDLAFPEITKEMMLKGARMIFCTSFWLAGDKYGSITSPEVRGKIPEIDTESIFVDACVPARAIENEVIFIYVNGCGEFSTAKFTDRLIGHTQIAVPFYSTVAKAGDEETLLISEIDLELTELAEKSYEIREDSPKGLAYLFEERSG